MSAEHSGPLPALGPTAGGQRLSLLDALRGFALAGVLLVNLGSFTLYYYLSPEQRAALPTAGFDYWARITLYFFVVGKFITLFSLLFGLGFAVQLMRAEERGTDGRGVYVRRLGVLLLIGLAHWALLWWGDVLRLYAVLGFGLLLFRSASPRVLLWTGLALACLGAALLSLVVDPLLEPALRTLPSEAVANAEALAIFSGRSYGAVVRENPYFDALYLARNWYEPLFIFGRFLLGFWAGRMLLFHEPAHKRDLLRRIFAGSLALGLLGNTLAVLRTYFDLAKRLPTLDAPLGRAVVEVITSSGTLALGVAYATGFALLFLRPKWQKRLEVLAPVGRMALTNYLTQTLLGVLIFYGIGLGVGPRFGIPGRLVAFALIFGAQIAFSHWWLARFRFGPAEWLWRSLTYGRMQPMRLVPRVPVPVAAR